MDQGLNASLNTQTPALLWALGCFSTLAVVVIIQAKTPLHHWVLVALRVVAINAEIKVLEKKSKKVAHKSPGFRLKHFYLSYLF